MNPPKNKVIDHLNRNGRDNRRCNLRICSLSENSQNSSLSSNNSTGVKGIWQNKSGTWRATIGYNGQLILLGTFKTKEEAIAVRKKAEEKYFTSFNVPDLPVEENWNN